MYLQVKKCRQDIVNENNCHSSNNMEKHPDKKEIDNKKKIINNNNNNKLGIVPEFIGSVQLSAILGTAHLLRKVLCL